MSFLKVIHLFYRRSIRFLMPSAILSFLIFCLIGSATIATTIPETKLLKEELNEKEVHLRAIIKQETMSGFSLDDILSTLSSLSIENLTLDYCIIIYLIYEYKNESFFIPYIGFTDTLLDVIGINNQEIIGSNEFETLSVNLTKPIPNSNLTNFTKSYLLNITRKDDLSSTNISRYLITNILNSNGMTLYYNTLYYNAGYKISNYFLVGNISILSDLVNFFDIKSREMGAFVVGFLEKGYINKLTIDKLQKEMVSKEKELFQQLIKNGFNPENIIIYSIKLDIHNSLNRTNDYVLRTIKYLSIPNLIIIFALLFTVEPGVYRLLKRKSKLFWSRGLSTKKVVTIFTCIEFLTDFSIFIIAQVIFSSIIYQYEISTFFIVSLLKTSALVFLLILICKTINILMIVKKNIVRNSKTGVIIRKDKMPKGLGKASLVALPVIVVVFQLFIIIEPLYWVPIFKGFIEIIGYIFCYILLLVTIVYHITLRMKQNQKSEQKNIKLENLLSRFFLIALKKIRIQQVITTFLYGLLFYLVMFSHTEQTFSNLYTNEMPICDLNFISFKDEGFNYYDVMNLKTKISEIEEIYPFSSSSGYIITTEFYSNSYLSFIDSSVYSLQDLGWNHFIGYKSQKYGNEILNNLKGRNVIINQYLAERSGLRIGENISLEIDLKDIIGHEDLQEISYGQTYSIHLDNLTIIGIVDVLPGVTFEKEYDVVIDISLLLEVFSSLKLEPRIIEFGINLNLAENLSSEDKKEKTNEIIDSILKDLNLSETTHSLSITTKEEYKSRFVLSNPKVEKYFIVLDLFIAVLFLPLTMVIFSRVTINSVAADLIQISNRGYSAKKLRKSFAGKIYHSLLGSMGYGILLGLVTGLIYARTRLISLFLATNLDFYFDIMIYLFTILAIGSLSTFIIIPFATRQIQNIISEKSRKVL